MKSEKLQDAVGMVRDDFVIDAEYGAKRQAKVYPWVKWVAAAACLGVAVLIAVPALNGRTPEVLEDEPPITQSLDAPTDKPVDEPTNEPTDEPTTPTTLQPGWAGNGIWVETREYANYEEFAADIDDPVFEAFAATEEAQLHNWRYQVLSDDSEYNKDSQLIQIQLSWSNSADVAFASDVEKLSVYSYNYEPLSSQSFGVADEEGTSKNYQVDGIEVQKIGGDDTQRITRDGVWHFTEGGGDFSSLTIERVNINGLWYYVEGTDEAEVDAIATALAQIANQI